jgi:beta-glucanase (GH16 family)
MMKAVTALVLLATTVAVAVPSGAVAIATGTVIDGFEGADASDWTFFGGNAAGGGGGIAADRPKAGDQYLSTGWGGEGTASGFYGGTFRNFDDTAQITPPADPWFNIWVYRQSDTTVDRYTLEVTLREDTDGDGWTDGSDDSIGLDTVLTSADFDDDWTLISAPLSSFFDRGTGGNGTFDGALDEVVLVLGGVEGGPGSVIELDLDQLAFTSGGPAAFDRVVFDDMEHGDPLPNGWFSFNGAVGGGGIAPNAADLPPSGGGAFSIETGWGSGGTPGFYGGFGRTNPVDVSGTDHVNFWINPDAGQDYTLELNLQDDDNGDGAAAAADDDEFQFDCVVSAGGPCATAGGGWQLVSIPLDDFFDDNSFFTGGNGVLDPTPTTNGGNGELINVVVAVVGGGTDVTFRTDLWTFTEGPTSFDPGPGTGGTIIDDFESGLPSGTDGDGIGIGFYTFQGAGSSIALSNPSSPPAPERPGAGSPNSVLQLDIDSTSFAGVIHGFENPAVDTWVTQDWSTSEGISMWFHGAGSGSDLFVDLLDNRNSGSTSDDAERYTATFVDDVAGWRLLEFPFAGFTRKEIGNGAPADGLGLFEMHGWAVGVLGTDGALTFYIDDVSLYGEAEPPGVSVGLATTITTIAEGTTGEVGVRLNRPLGADDPAEVTVDFRTEPAVALPGVEYTPASGTLVFTRGGPTELSFPVQTFDDDKFEGLERIVVRLTNPVGAEGGGQGSILIEDDDPYDPDLIDDFENGAFLWDGGDLVDIDAVDAGDRPDADVVETAMAVTTAGGDVDYRALRQEVADGLALLIPSSSGPDAEAIQRAIERLEDGLDPENWINGSTLDTDNGGRVFQRDREAAAFLTPVTRKASREAEAVMAAIEQLVLADADLAALAVAVAERNGAPETDLVAARRQLELGDEKVAAGEPSQAIEHYKVAWERANAAVQRLEGKGVDVGLGAAIRDFPAGQDWTGTETLDFWFDGTGSGEDVTVVLKDNRAADPGPAGWDLVWSDEFDEPAGSPPNPDNWTNELGDVTPDGKNGWGNDELQYYTDSPDNAATDGNGNLVLTLREADGSLDCYYGPCEYTSARLLSWRKAEFAYGRIESRLQVPQGAGVWPAFWSLGTDIDRNPWPGAGEIDVMEFVGREPNEIFGTIHGPGYSGGGSFGGIYDFGSPVFDEYHTFTVEWQPNLITWYVDGIQYHQATPADVAPNPWVFEKPFFLLLNLAVGGNFGGPVGDDTTFPQSYAIDYVRVYQGPDTAERFEATFVDDTDGWKQVSVPIGDFVRSADQPDGAPDDGLGLDEVWGYGFDLPAAAGTYRFDRVTTVPVPPPAEVMVTTVADAGPGSLREALATVADGGTIDVDPALAGQTIALTSGQLVVPRSLTIDGSAAPGLAVSGSDSSRVFEVVAGATVAINDLVIRDGAAAPQGGGVLNNGDLTMQRVVVTDNVENSAGPPNFAFGGGGIYNGDGASLNLIDSEISDNLAVNHPGGGVYGFFNSTITITRSTISGNTSGDVAGGVRSLGTINVENSTFSGNTSTAWHGGGIFHTDGQLTVDHSTFTGNTAPAGTASGIVVATFGAPASMTLTNSIMEGNNGAFGCATEGGATATITSGGGNIDDDGSCQLTGAGDQPDTDALLGPLADNGGPTLTHAPGAGSPAIDGAIGTCPATDQRGVARPQGAACDIGSVEVS